jgi:hypothetical protein
MNRRQFVFQIGSVALTAWAAPAWAQPLQIPQNKIDRLAVGTLFMRYRFKQTPRKPGEAIPNELTLLDVPAYYKKRFGIRKIEFWNQHFESLDPAYLGKLKESIKAADCQLFDVQIDRISYNLADTDDEKRARSIKDVKEWIDAVSFLGSTCIRINPGSKGTVEKSIESLTELNAYAKSKNLIIITANHFGIEMDPDKHVQIAKCAGVYTEPDFGNYLHDDKLLGKLEKIVPHAYLISAKVDEFRVEDGKLEHVSYDFDKCVQLCERLGFKGTYMVAQWSSKPQDIDYEKVGDWVIEHVTKNI